MSLSVVSNCQKYGSILTLLSFCFLFSVDTLSYCARHRQCHIYLGSNTCRSLASTDLAALNSVLESIAERVDAKHMRQ